MPAPPPAEKTCAICGRRFTWRKRWAAVWDEIRTCSARCRGLRLGETDRALERTLLELLARRGRDPTLCPSEVARAVRPEDWRDWMERTRMAARRLVARGEVRILQGGRVVDPSTARGPIRIGRA
ncbi:MAG: DUF2256 and DUF3253 domain-containing protein [Deltaproteobacteria bacterium]|nr:MAG: DUF2256 and DUF3253 domain-containing protein [Deltaproteobacteria bacterium]